MRRNTDYKGGLRNVLDQRRHGLTDFSFAHPAQEALRLAYLVRGVAMSPHPRAHALYADKRNHSLLCDEAFLRATGVGDEAISTLLASVPRISRWQ